MQQEKWAILVTGASGGLGLALVRAATLLQDIDLVVAADIEEKIENQFREEENILGIQMDAGSEESIKRAKERLYHLQVRIKYIINNAGIMMFFPISEASEQLLEKIIRVNTFGPLLTVSTFLDDLADSKGRVIQISSDNVRLSGVFQPYPASKIALESFSIAMRQELSLLDIKLIMIRPGAIRTHLLDRIRSGKRAFDESRYNSQYREFEKLALSEVGKTIDPETVARITMKALTTRNPKLIYSLNKNRMITLLRRFPWRWIDKLVVKRIK